MSTILKALRRIEEDKHNGAARPLREEVVLVRPAGRRPLRTVVLAGIGAVAFAATWLALASLGGDEEEPAPAAPPVAAAPLAAVAPPSAVARSSDPAARAPAAQLPAPIPTAAAQGAAQLPAEPVPPAIEDEVVVLGDLQSARPSRVVEEPPRPAPVPRAFPRQESRPVYEKRAPVAARVETIDEVEDPPPARTARTATPVRVERTSWHPTPEQRSARIAVGAAAAVDVREGDRVGPFVVREIELDGVVLDGSGVELRPRVGE